MAPAMYFPRSTDVIVEMPASRSEPNSRRKTSHDGGSEPCDFEPIPRTCAAAVDVATSVQPRRSQCSLQLSAQPEFLCACLPKRRSVSSRRQSSVPGFITVAAPAATPKRTASRNVSPGERARPIPPTIESQAPTRLSIFTSGESKHSQPSAEAATRRLRLTKQRRLRTC